MRNLVDLEDYEFKLKIQKELNPLCCELKKIKMLIAWKTYEYRHVFHVANRQKVDIDDTITEKTTNLRDLSAFYHVLTS